jgi:hypothetical protein
MACFFNMISKSLSPTDSARLLGHEVANAAWRRRTAGRRQHP